MSLYENLELALLATADCVLQSVQNWTYTAC